MSSIQKANSGPTWWVGKSPKYGIVTRIKMRRGLTDGECKANMKMYLEEVDKKEHIRILNSEWKALREQGGVSARYEFLSQELGRMLGRETFDL